ncbi:peptidase inhibitor family I36 protein [Streptomyces sp. G35A]
MAFVLPIAAGSVLMTAPTAQAYTGKGCDLTTEWCGVFFYNSSYEGSRTAFMRDSVPDLAGYKFLDTGAGQGLAVKNNAASFINGGNANMTVFYNSNYNGPCDSFKPLSAAPKLRNTYNENASLRFGYTSTSCYTWTA